MKPDAICTYCHDHADTEDHLEPVSRRTSRRRKGKMATCGRRVPCCSLCNSLLGACDLFTIRERAGFLLIAYARRYHGNPLPIADKVRHLIHVAAGFPLAPELEAMELERRHLIAEQIAERRAEEEADEAARLAAEAKAAELAEARRLEREAAAAARKYDRELRRRIDIDPSIWLLHAPKRPKRLI